MSLLESCVDEELEVESVEVGEGATVVLAKGAKEVDLMLHESDHLEESRSTYRSCFEKGILVVDLDSDGAGVALLWEEVVAIGERLELTFLLPPSEGADAKAVLTAVDFLAFAYKSASDLPGEEPRVFPPVLLVLLLGGAVQL